jgi:cytochrome c-type biogenesis protein CcsB
VYNPYFFNAAMLIYIVAFVFYLLFIATKNKLMGTLAFGVIITGFFVHLAGLLLRWQESYATGFGYIPLSNLYESLVFFSWAIVLIYLIVDIAYHQRTIGVIAAPLAAIALALTSLVPGSESDIRPLIPALQSNWLAVHVITCFLGYAAFAIACGVSVAYMIQTKKKASGHSPISWLPSPQTLDEINYKAIAIGFPLLTLGIITGAAWASYAWGSYWSWDPKETWSLITWFIYAAFLHARYTHEWRGSRTALLSIVGFGAVIFTYFGVTFLLSGLHSYMQ